MYKLQSKHLGKFDVAVCGGGVAGVGAAVAAARNGAKVVLIESTGALGGTATSGLMGNILDGENKGGLIKEWYDFLNEYELTIAHRGNRFDENGKPVPGRLVDHEASKYFFEKVCAEAGVKVLFNSLVSAVDIENEHINSILISSLCGNYEISADVYIDATGFGSLSDLAGLKWDIGNPPNPASMSLILGGMPADYDGADSVAEKDEYANMLKENGIFVSAEQTSAKRMPGAATWIMGFNFEYDVMPDNIERFSEAVMDGRKEAFEVIQAHRKIKGYEKLHTQATASYFGLREGRRVYGEYRLTDDDIIEGKRFHDGICLVTAGVDVHKLHDDDTTEVSRGVKSKPYHIPYRCLVPLGCDNMLLAGRCISGDFYPFASYRMIGNMTTVGEAAGYAAALCSKKKIRPSKVDGTCVAEFMKNRGHEL